MNSQPLVILLAVLLLCSVRTSDAAVVTSQEDVNVLHPLSDSSFKSSAVQYECWEPKKGLSKPVVTIVSVVSAGSDLQSAVMQNRKAFALQHRHRYCQLNDVTDNTRSHSYAKIPLMMAILPCTDYAVYVDGNAMITNHALSFAPWLAHMQAKGLDLLISESNHKDAPLDLGVFAMRPAPWLLTLFKELYNRCACDWSRLHDWPAEQGMLYDILVERMKEPWFHKVQVAKTEGWNRHPADFPAEVNNTMLRPDDLVMRLLGVPQLDTGKTCGVDGTCNLQEFKKHLTQAVADKLVQPPLVAPAAALKPFRCLSISRTSLISADSTNNNNDSNRVHSTILDWHTSPNGFIKDITLGEIPCLGRHDSKCDVPHHWGTTSIAPWTLEPIQPLSSPPLDIPWATVGTSASSRSHPGSGSSSAAESASTTSGASHTSVETMQPDAPHPAAASMQLAMCEEAMLGLRPSCPRPCLDVVFLYHEDDKKMFVDNGVFLAARKHLQGIRNFYVISKSNKTFEHLMDERSVWVDETIAPFSPESWKGSTNGRPRGWMYQQTLKMWAAKGNIPGACENVMFVDSDTLFLKDFDPVSFEASGSRGEGGGDEGNDGKEGGKACKTRFKYNLSTMKSGAWYGDITNADYHKFVEYITGVPKAEKDQWTAINHWQVMQRDVVKAMERVVVGLRGVESLEAAMIKHGMTEPGMSEYEAYFSFAWHYFRDRIRVVHVPYVMRPPSTCGYNDEKNRKFKEKSVVAYFTCHDNLELEWYTNCRGRDNMCDPE